RAPFFQEWVASPDFKHLELVKSAVEAASGKPLGKSLHELFGQDVVIAWYHTPGSKADLARNSVVLVNVENTAAESALSTWNTLDKQRKVTRKHRNVAYIHSVKASAGQDSDGFWYTILDSVLAISAREDRIQRVIDFSLESTDEAVSESKVNDGTPVSSTSHSDCLAAYEPFAKAYVRRPQSELMTVYLNPRIVGSELGRASKDLSVVEAVLARCQWLTLRLTNDESLQLEFVADYDNRNVPDLWEQWLGVARSSRLPVEAIPSNSLVALSGQFSAASISEIVRQAIQKHGDIPMDLVRARRVFQGLLLGLDPLNDVLPNLGPAWVASVVPRDPTVSTTFPADVLFAIQLRSQSIDGQAKDASQAPSLESALDHTMRTGLEVVAAVHNARATGQQVSVVRQQEIDGVTIHYADPVAFFQPAYAISNGYLVVATSPKLCGSFLKSAINTDFGTDDNSIAQPNVEQPELAGNLQLVVASSVSARQILKHHHHWFIKQAERDKVSEADAKQRLAQLDQFLQLFDRAWLTASVNERAFRVTAGISSRMSVAAEK
ncbi:MAG: hypothetical protein O3B13_23430, partial [Planctomycetota bacterium]|nr:hypothetical protein [Planctomycetota bacterium]